MLGVLVVAMVAGAQPELVELDNGMRWLLVPRVDSGLVAGVVAVAAGSVDEREGETGAAHLLEHLAFAGTPMVGSWRGWTVEAREATVVEALLAERAELATAPANDPRVLRLETALVQAEQRWREKGDALAILRLMGEHEVRTNANTTKDRTLSVGEFAHEKLELWLSVEAQRFAAPVFREFRAERAVVVQELRDRQSDLSLVHEALWAQAFAGTGYAWSTIGREADLWAMHPGVLDALYTRRYVASNAVGVLVGELDVANTKALLKKTFGQLPARPAPGRTTPAFAPRPETPAVVKTRTPLLVLGFPRPADSAPGAPAWEVTEHLLSSPSGPLQKLVDEGLAVSTQLSRGPGVVFPHLQVVSLVLSPGADAARVKARLFEVLAGWTPAEAALGRTRLALELERRKLVRRRLALAEALGEELLFTGAWDSLLRPRHEAVGRAEVRAVLDGWTEARAFVAEGRP